MHPPSTYVESNLMDNITEIAQISHNDEHNVIIRRLQKKLDKSDKDLKQALIDNECANNLLIKESFVLKNEITVLELVLFF